MKNYIIISVILILLILIVISYCIGKKNGYETALVKKNCSGSWPNQTWKEEDYLRKQEKLEECRKLYGTLKEGKTWE